MNEQQIRNDTDSVHLSPSQREDEFVTILEGFLRRSSLEQSLRMPRWMMWS